MVASAYTIIWSKRALQHLRKVYDYISCDSVQNAHKVVNEIATCMEKARQNAEHYPPDKYKQPNDGSYRAFEKHSYRIAYRVVKTELRVLRVRHTSMEPLPY